MGEELVSELNLADARQALERFVVDNDDLLALEERIGRFNIFDALGIARTEIRHSNFLAWLLDPAESHGQGSLFLKAVLMDLLKQAPADMRPLSPIELDGEELRGVEIRREWRNIDLLITCQQPQFVIAIENKIDAGEHSGQLQRYEDIVAAEFTGWRSMFVFLTTDGDDASDEDWVPYSYADIHRVLDRVRRTGAGAIGDDVAAFLDHYLQLIGSRFVNDPQIDQLCKRIYENHRQALDLIFARLDLDSSSIFKNVETMLNSDGSPWLFLLRRKRFISFAWQPLVASSPPVGTEPDRDPRAWIVFEIRDIDGTHYLSGYVGPVYDERLRLNAILRLTANGNSTGFKLWGKMQLRVAKNGKLPDWVLVFKEKFDLPVDAESKDFDEALILKAIENCLAKLATRLSAVPDVLRPIFDEWRTTQQ